jgi:hypothetical protein
MSDSDRAHALSSELGDIRRRAHGVAADLKSLSVPQHWAQEAGALARARRDLRDVADMLDRLAELLSRRRGSNEELMGGTGPTPAPRRRRF